MNAKKELLDLIEALELLNPPGDGADGYEGEHILAADVRFDLFPNGQERFVLLPTIVEGVPRDGGESYTDFLKFLDREYTPVAGAQYLFGTIWLAREGVWLERRFEEDEEWWEVLSRPPLPEGQGGRMYRDSHRLLIDGVWGEEP